MSGPSRNFFTVFSTQLVRSTSWYVELLGYRVEFASDWFVQLQSASQSSVELGLLAREHDLVPAQFRDKPSGGMLTVVVNDVDAVHQLAQSRAETIIEEPTNQFYGQRRLLLLDPDGLLVDVSSECTPDPRWIASLKS